MRGHAWTLLKSGPLDVVIKVGDPVPLASFADRKALARHSEAQVRENVVRILRARPSGTAIAVTAPDPVPSPVRVRPRAAEPGQKWT
jgi:hypothetical protein